MTRPIVFLTDYGLADEFVDELERLAGADDLARLAIADSTGRGAAPRRRSCSSSFRFMSATWLPRNWAVPVAWRCRIVAFSDT